MCHAICTYPVLSLDNASFIRNVASDEYSKSSTKSSTAASVAGVSGVLARVGLAAAPARRAESRSAP